MTKPKSYINLYVLGAVAVMCLVTALYIQLSQANTWDDNCMNNLQGKVSQINRGKGALCLDPQGRILDSR